MPGLNTFVCLKPVPDPEKWSDITLDPKTKAICRENVNQIINPLDRNALEAALQLRDKVGGTVTVITMGPPSARENIIEALALGADKGVLLSDRTFAGADTLATSYTLAAGIKKTGDKPGIIFCGARSLDGSTAQVGPQLAAHLGYVHVTSVNKFEVLGTGVFQLRMQLEDGYLEMIASPPLVISVNSDCNRPRAATLMGIMAAESKEIITLTAKDFDAGEKRFGLKGSPTRAEDVFFPDLARKGEILQGKPEETVNLLLDKLSEAGVLRTG